MNYLFSGTTNLGINKFCNLIRSALQFMCTNTFYIKLKQRNYNRKTRTIHNGTLHWAVGWDFYLEIFFQYFSFFNLLSVNRYLETNIFDLGQGRFSELFSRKELFCVNIFWGVAFWCKIVSLGQESQSLYFYKIKLVWMTLDISASNNNGRFL